MNSLESACLYSGQEKVGRGTVTRRVQVDIEPMESSRSPTLHFDEPRAQFDGVDVQRAAEAERDLVRLVELERVRGALEFRPNVPMRRNEQNDQPDSALVAERSDPFEEGECELLRRRRRGVNSISEGRASQRR